MVVIRNIVLVGKLKGIDAKSIPKSKTLFNGVKLAFPNATCPFMEI